MTEREANIYALVAEARRYGPLYVKDGKLMGGRFPQPLQEALQRHIDTVKQALRPVPSLQEALDAPTGDSVADRLQAALKQAGDEGMDGTQVRDLFHRSLSASRIREAVDLLESLGRIAIEKFETGGRPCTVYTYVRFTDG